MTVFGYVRLIAQLWVNVSDVRIFFVQLTLAMASALKIPIGQTLLIAAFVKY